MYQSKANLKYSDKTLPVLCSAGPSTLGSFDLHVLKDMVVRATLGLERPPNAGFQGEEDGVPNPDEVPIAARRV